MNSDTLAKLPVELARALANAYNNNSKINAFTSLVSGEGKFNASNRNCIALLLMIS